ncbi:putative hemolysin domain protein [Bordetella bronchiseptica]|nr:putative hemolysin domain protein [Bordetella bronchiseptica]
MPVAGSRVRPGGRPLAVKVSVSPLSISWNWPEMSTGAMASPSSLAWSPRVTPGVSVGASLVPVTVTVSVAVEVAPDGSVIV